MPDHSGGRSGGNRPGARHGRAPGAAEAAAPGHYVHVNGLDMYYEHHHGGRHGSLDDAPGRPLVLLHGGLLTLDLSFRTMLPALATRRHVIGVDLQGHGRTADTDREMTVPALADDVVALLDVLGIERADALGFSLGGMAALDVAVRRPERLGRLVLASVPYRADGYLDEVRDPALHATSRRLPTEADFREMADTYAAVAPDPGHFAEFTAKTEAAAAFEGWSEQQLRAIALPVLLVFGDTDLVGLPHASRMHELIPASQLAILPGTTHMRVTHRPELVPMVERFLAG